MAEEPKTPEQADRDERLIKKQVGKTLTKFHNLHEEVRRVEAQGHERLAQELDRIKNELRERGQQ